LGVCLATSGPGAIHLLNGLYDAKLDHAPVLAITGQTYHDLIGTQYQQEVDLLSLFKDVAVYNQMVLGAGHVRSLVDAGCRAALSHRGVARITVPVDLQEQEVGKDEKSAKNVEGHTSRVWRAAHRTRRSGDGGSRHALHGPHGRPVPRSISEARRLPRRADRSGALTHRPQVPRRSRIVRRREIDDAGPPAADPPARRPLVPR